MKYHHKVAALAFTTALFLSGCKAESKVPVISTDMSALSRMVTLDIPLTLGRYEIFTTPESTNAAPGPTSYVALIGEFSAKKADLQVKEAPPGFWLLPNSVRPWLSPQFRRLLEKYAGDKLPQAEDCFQLRGKNVKNGEKLAGIVCFSSDVALVYMPLFSED